MVNLALKGKNSLKKKNDGPQQTLTTREAVDIVRFKKNTSNKKYYDAYIK